MELGMITSFFKNLIVSIIVFCGMIVSPGYYKEARELVMSSDINTFISNQTTLAFDKDGNIISKLKEGKDSYYIEFETISEYAKEAFIATEDKDFYRHNGVDLNGLGRAVAGLIKNREISGGGSTITQQLARNIFLSHEKSFERKIKEIFISKELEKKYEKDEILELYINTIYFSNGVYGLESAARKYFGKSSTELTLAQTAYLCAIPNNPTLYNPLVNPDNTKKRQERILGYMLEDKYITSEEYKSAKAEEIVLNSEVIKNNGYVDTYIVESSTKILMELNGFKFKDDFKDISERDVYREEYLQAQSLAQKELYTGGYRIYTSIDSDKQRALQEALDNSLSENQELDENGIYALQGSAVSIDNVTGKVIALVGGRTQEGVSYSFNRAFQSYRQPGSTAKPLVVYAPSFEKGYYPSSILIDEKDEDGPQNYNNNYEGAITLRYAVEDSKNTVAWNLFREITPEYGLSFLKAMNFKKIVDEDNNLASALGGLTYGTNTLEMASAYSTLARDGVYFSPTCILKITDADGNIIYEDNTQGKEVYTVKSARLMTDVLQSVMINGSGSKYQIPNMPSAGKTGTTNDIKDGWFCGYTPYITTSVWVGYDTPKQLEGIHGSKYPGEIWKNYMTIAHEGLESKIFTAYENQQQEEEAIKSTEEQKLLVYNIEKDMSSYENCDTSSQDAINESCNMYNSLIERIGQVTDESKRNELYERIEKIRASING